MIRALFIILLLNSTCVAQPISLETYTPANGLVDARIVRMFQDSRGRLFILTREGFSIFDGQHFDNYGNAGISRTEIINGIAEYPNGLVKLFSFDGVIYNVQNREVRIDSSQTSILTETNNVFDLGANDKLIITNYAMFRESAGKLRRLKPPVSGGRRLFIDNVVNSGNWLILSHTRNIYEKSIYLYSLETEQITDSIPNSFIVESVKSPTGEIYLNRGFWQSMDMKMIQAGKLAFLQPTPVSNLLQQFKPDLTFFDLENNLWLYDNNTGYCKINLQNFSRSWIKKEQGLLANPAGIFQDAEKNMWFYSRGNGIQKLHHSPLSQYYLDSLKGGLYCFRFHRDEVGNIFCSTNEGYFLNQKQLPVKKGPTPSNTFYYRNQVWQFDDYKTLRSSGGKLIDLEDHIENYKPEDFQLGYPTHDLESRIIIAGNILLILDRNLNIYTYRCPYFCDNVVVDRKNNYWLFLRSNVVIRLSWQHGKLVQTLSQTLPNLNPRCSLLWNDSTFAIGTRMQGLCFYQLKADTLKQTGQISKVQNLSNQFIYSLSKQQNKLLVGTGTGLDEIRFFGMDTLVENLSLRNSIFSTFSVVAPLNDSSQLCLSAEGKLYILANEKKNTRPHPPSVFFRGIWINNTEVQNQTTFSYNNNNFLFSVSAPSFYDNKNIKYHFLLKEMGRQWEQHTNSADFAINNLTPGSYTLVVVVHFPGIQYPDQKLIYSFVIRKPYWQQAWFIALLVIIGGFSGFVLIRNYYRRQLEKQRTLLEKKQAIEKERTRIATDMHDDFGASLSRIKFLSEKLKLQNREESVLKQDLNKISGYSDEMAEKMNEIVWALNQKYDSLGDLVSFCRAYAADYLSQHNIALQFSGSDLADRKIAGEVRRNIFLVLKEALHNVVKHARATEVEIAFSDEKQLVMRIVDNGIGINMNQIRPFANGIENMKKRMASVRGQISIEKNNGTHLVVNVPL